MTAETGCEAIFVECDVTQSTDLAVAVRAAEKFSEVDIMVNNVGLYREEWFFDVTESEYEQLLDVHVKGTFSGAQAAARRKVENGGESILNISSVAGVRGSTRSSTYSASKGAVRLLTYALADELGSEVHVNVVYPGIIETKMTIEDVPLTMDEQVRSLLRRSRVIGSERPKTSPETACSSPATWPTTSTERS